MGINGLVTWLREKVPDLIVTVPVASLSGQRLAVDASVYLYKFICMDNQMKGKWLDMFINFIICLRKNNIRPVFIFDGKPPKQKERTQKERRAIRHATEQRVLELEELIDTLSEYDFNEKIPKELKKRIDAALNENTKYHSRKEVMKKLNEKFKKDNSTVIHITPKHNKQVQDLLTFMGLPWFKATGEAERSCSWMCKWGYAKGVITTDSDVLAYGTPIFIKDLKTNQDLCQIIRYQDVLEVLDLNEKQFTDFCIMCGTDYNKRIKGYGAQKSYELLCEHENLDSIANTTLDTEILHYQEVRGLFKLPDKDSADQVLEGCTKGKFRLPPVKELNKGGLLMLLMETKSRFTVEYIQMHTYQAKFVVS